MRIGDMRHPLTVQNVTRTPSDDGGYDDVYANANPATEWAHIAPATAALMERVAGGQVDSKATHVVTMRYRSDVTTRTRLVHESTRYLYVRGVSNINERDEWLVLLCEEMQ